jgi:hypothetical protein
VWTDYAGLAQMTYHKRLHQSRLGVVRLSRPLSSHLVRRTQELQAGLAEIYACGSGCVADRCDSDCVARTMAQIMDEFGVWLRGAEQRNAGSYAEIFAV